MISSIIQSIGNEGQIVLCLPDRSMSGRRIPLFTTRSWVTEQLIGKANELGFEVVTPVNIAPRIGHLFHPPHFWTSERALRRSILFFRLKKKQPRGAAIR
jgi:hypothetical protein